MLLMTFRRRGRIGIAGDFLMQLGGTRHLHIRRKIRRQDVKQVHQSFVHIFGAAILFAGSLCIAILLLLKVMQSLAAIIPR